MKHLVFLFTDIEGSTRLWENYPQEMYEILRKHDDILRESIGSCGGTVFRTVGDAFYATFDTASDAIRAAIRIQTSLEAQDWSPVGTIRVRIGIHAGVAEYRDGDYYGPELNRVHRLLSAGHGGQVLCSSTVAQQERLGVELSDLGLHRLKDLSAPFQVFQVVHESLRIDFPRLRTLDPVKTNLPHQHTSFVGRSAECGELNGLIRGHRLVTLVGAGGCGKTRLAYQVASELIDDFDGVWVSELAALTSSASLAVSIAHSLGENIGLGEDPDERLTAVLRDSNVVILLDNCEHLLDEVARVAMRLQQECPRVRILATSREALGCVGEVVMRVPSLDTVSDGVELFLERSGIEGQESTVSRIVERLDGIPLAIELAAARAAFQTPEEILEGLEDRFALLSAGNRGALPRHRTLFESINWSYQLLHDEERSALQSFSLFANGAEADLFAKLCGRPISSARLVLTGLCEKSFMVRQDGRYRLLESVAAFGIRALDESGQLAEQRHRFGSILADYAKSLEEMASTEQAVALNLMDLELANFRRALDWLPASEALRLASSLSLLWEFRGHWREGRSTLERLLSTEGLPAADRAHALLVLGTLCRRLGDFDPARAYTKESYLIFKGLGDRQGLGDSANVLGGVAWAQGDFGLASSWYREALETRREISDQLGTAVSTHNLGVVQLEFGDYVGAEMLLKESLELARLIRDDVLVSMALNNLGNTYSESGQLERALEAYRESMDWSTRLNDNQGVASAENNLAIVLGHLGRHQEAVGHFMSALEEFRRLGDLRAISATISSVSDSLYLTGQQVEAIARIREARELHRSFTDPRGVCYLLEVCADISALEGSFDEAVTLMNWASRYRKQIGHPMPKRDAERRREVFGSFLEAQNTGLNEDEITDSAALSLVDEWLGSRYTATRP